MTHFRPCIDLHAGKVKQIVGGTLCDNGAGPDENFVSDKSASWFAELYREHNITGGHVIQLGQGNQQAAIDALAAWPEGMQVGGGINIDNAQAWLEAGASHVIVTSWLFDQEGKFQEKNLRDLAQEIGAERLVVDLSCRKTDAGWTVAMNRWQTLTNVDITHATLDSLAEHCDEYLIHAADVEGLCAGIDVELVKHMGAWAGIPMTYAGGVANLEDVQIVDQMSSGNIDVTVGSALDIFGGAGVTFDDLLAWNHR
ncbi:MAG: phosphoribosylformimino-5-aminoimidazole carboxamide ribotide isomerase [Akkermansiaceae bacterium]|nr:phosphoribosylformimino-5-aminoimidazole carboxamide ribotide isomerase [Akkermansiaceae bacterium]